MKIREIISLIGVVVVACVMTSCSQYKVYSVRESPSLRVGGGVLYALPKTRLCVEMTVERRDLSGSPYSEYATDYLGVEPSMVDTSYRLVEIDVSGENVADEDNYYYVEVGRGSVEIDGRHLLLAIGNGNENRYENDNENSKIKNQILTLSKSSPSPVLYDRVDTFYTRYDVAGRPSMLSSRKDVMSVKQRAAAAAERLEEIQTKQQELIEGEYEGSYSAEAVKYLYGQLKRQEAEIVALFCGETRREKVRFYVEPQMRRNEDSCDTLIWFSPEVGFVGDAEHLPDDSFPVICVVHNNSGLNTASRFVKYHTSGYTANGSGGRSGRAASRFKARKGFRYRIPVTTTVEVSTPVY